VHSREATNTNYFIVCCVCVVVVEVGGVEGIVFLGVPNMVKYAFLLLFCRFNLLGIAILMGICLKQNV